MNKKHRTIKAVETLIEKYEHPQGKSFFSVKSCPLCKIHNNYDNPTTTCRGCPLVNPYGEDGCGDFVSFELANRIYFARVGDKYIDGHYPPFPMDAKTPRTFMERAKFFRKYLPIFKTLPDVVFTKKGWKYFIDLIPQMIYEIKPSVKGE